MTPETQLGLDDDASDAVVTDDWMTALEPEGGVYEWTIPTGRDDAQGTPIYLKVEAVDPKDPSILISYMSSPDKESATRSLFALVIRSPAQICEPENFNRLTSSVKSTLTWKILTLLGLNRDFLKAFEGMAGSPKSGPHKKSSTPSPTGMDSIPDTSESPSPQKTSTTPTPTPEQPTPESAGSSSETSDSSSQAPSPTNPSNTPTTSTPESGSANTSSKRPTIKIGSK